MQELLAFALLTALTIGSAAGANLTVEIQDSDGNRLNSQLTLKQGGSTVAESSGYLDTSVTDGENYTLIQQIDSGPNVTIYNFSISQDLNLDPVIYKNQNPEKDFLTDTDPLYYINRSFNFSKAEFKISRSQPDSIAKCTSISSDNCASWSVQSTSGYQTSYSGSTFAYNVTSFSGYTSGVETPLPEIKNIEVYNVSGVQDRRNDGTLIEEGLNKTFNLRQEASNEYRFEFNVTNNGSDTWVLTTDDKLLHKALNQSWRVNQTDDIYYRVGGTVKEGGSFSSGELS